MKKGDIFLIIFYLVLSVSISFVFLKKDQSYDKKYIEISVDNELKYKIDLPVEKERKIHLQTKHGFNDVLIKDSKVRIIKSDCKNQTCIKDGEITKVNDILVCLPNKLLVEIKGQKNSEVDINSY
ncbi:MAG: NusG domain II-containing protein [Bacillota bacterium]